MTDNDYPQTENESLADVHDDAAEALSDLTGRPKQDFEPPEDIEYPDFDDLELVEVDD